MTSTPAATTRQEARPPAAAKPVRWAADAVSALREGARLRLDYSPYAAVRTVLRGLGAYAGEVIVRQTGAEWWATGGDHWVRTPDGRLWDPIEEARRCYSGDGSLRLLCREATAGR
jgi:hypothetical protein